MDVNGNGRLVEKQKLPLCMDMKPDAFTFDKFRYMCILSGCDYLDSLPGIGLKKALKFISLTAETDPIKFLDKLPRYLNMRHLLVTEEYKNNFLTAEATFKHQVVFDPLLKKLTHLTDPALCGTRPEHCRNAGKFFDDEIAYQVAIGNLNPFSHEKYDDWSPSKSCNNSFHSIWSNTYVKKISRSEQKQSNRSENAKIQETKIKEIIKTNKEIERQETAHSSELESELSIYYRNKETKKLTRNTSIYRDDPNDEKIVMKEDSIICENISDKYDESTSNSEHAVIKQESPTLPKKFVNPFLKKKLSKFGSTEIKTDLVVRSKYFHSKSVDSGEIEKLNDDEIENENVKIENENDAEKCKKRKIGSDEDTSVIVDESPVKDVTNSIEQSKISLSQPVASAAKRAKFSRCRSVGLPPKSKNNQPTLQAFFGNFISKKN